LADKFDSLSGDTSLGYLLLSSYEQPLRELRETQSTLFLVSLLGILFSSAVVWFLIRKITQPLRQLRASAEAVGRGDFSSRVPVISRDECGDLAEAFNRMTENLKGSRDELEKIVQTLKTTQAQLIQNEKLSAIGEFVAGVTHELNNPLTALIGFAELLQKSGVDERQRRFSDRIVQSAQRCHKIVQSLLSFARQHSPERKLANLNELLEATVDFLAYEMRTSNIHITTDLAPNLPPVMGDAHQLQQVFLNIINNSRQAIEGHQPQGSLRICSGICGGQFRITFQDDGPGISQDNLKKIFNPFFTTKEAGKGTGLGLSLSYGIIKEHGGSITAQSQRGAGATFIVELPIASPEAVAEPEKSATSQPASSHAEGQGKRVLVIDDEEPILDLVREVLASKGYQVDTANDGETALRHLHQNRYDLALCDWKMPGLNGQQVYQKLRTLDPGAAARWSPGWIRTRRSWSCSRGSSARLS
jgi:signal transduction histidine kinase